MFVRSLPRERIKDAHLILVAGELAELALKTQTVPEQDMVQILAADGGNLCGPEAFTSRFLPVLLMPIIRWRPIMTNSILQRAAVTMLLAASFGLANAADVPVTLTGDQEVPAVTTDAKATGKLTIKADKSVSGKITTTGIESTVAHIHEAAPGKNGPPIITLEKGADSSFSVPAGSKLTDEQYKSFKAGNLYVNVHSAEHKDGEIRTQLKP